MLDSQSLTLPFRGGMIVHKLKISAYPSSSLRSRLNFQTKQVLSCKWVLHKKQFRLKNLIPRLEMRKYAMQDGAGDIQELDYGSRMTGGYSSLSEEVKHESVISSPVDVSHLEDTTQELIQDRPTFLQARYFTGFLITAALSFLIINLLLFC